MMTLESPLSQSLKKLDATKDGLTIFLYAVIFALFLFLSCLPFSGVVQKTIMSKFHLTLQPFERWAAAQLIPSMYSFENKLFWSYQNRGMAFDIPSVPRVSVNHYPLRMLFFTTNRRAAVSDR